MSLALFFGICLLVSGVAIRIAMVLAGRFGILDQPGGHKQHDTSTPFVGGVGVIAVLVGALYLTEQYFPGMSRSPVQSIALGAIVLFVTGMADDIWHLGFRVRFAMQAAAAISMVFLGGIKLHSLGQLVPGINVDLGPWAVPFTVFATIGLINALNMIDGIDGLSGFLSLISLGFIAATAAMADRNIYLVLVIGMMGSVAGFLCFNLRYPGNRRARVFLGDNGSMLLGFVFAWLFIALSQGSRQAMTPVTSLWFFAVPLMDTVGVMLRRICQGKSPFSADRNHLHHLFLRAGFRVSDTVWILVMSQLVLCAIGLGSLMLGLPEYLMFWLFLATFAGYFSVIVRPWRFVPRLRRICVALGFPSSHARGIFVGYFRTQDRDYIFRVLDEELRPVRDYRMSFHQVDKVIPDGRNLYGVVELEVNDDEAIGELRRIVAHTKRQLADRPNCHARFLMRRDCENDRRVQIPSAPDHGNMRRTVRQERRSIAIPLAVYSAAGQRNTGEPYSVTA